MAVSDPHVIAEFMNSLEKKLDILRESYAENGGFEKLAAESAEAMNGGKYAAFISVCDINTRASVLRGAGDSPEEAWESACHAEKRAYACMGEVGCHGEKRKGFVRGA